MSKITFLQALLILLLTVAVGVGSGYLIIYYLSPSSEIGQLFTRITILLCIGLGVGLVCRFAIPARYAILKVLFGLLGSIGSLVILDAFFSAPYRFLTSTQPVAGWSVGQYTQLGALAIVSLFIALIGKKRVVIAPTQATPQTRKKTKPFDQIRSGIDRNFHRWKSKISSIDLKPTVKKTPQKKKASPRTVSASTRPKTSAPSVKVNVPTKSPTVKQTTTRKTKSRSRFIRSHAQDVKLVGTEEHRCPYCLEEVKKNDPRGVVICPDCGTWHHKDCWDVTGSCQIAHKHAL
ncbi:MAG: hypothetical protein GYA52_04560 [Chloroflexi bacterium]|nr:hypothetical protein [Chloroflexota bacterium]